MYIIMCIHFQNNVKGGFVKNNNQSWGHSTFQGTRSQYRCMNSQALICAQNGWKTISFHNFKFNRGQQFKNHTNKRIFKNIMTNNEQQITKAKKNPKSWLLAHNQQGGPIWSYY